MSPAGRRRPPVADRDPRSVRAAARVPEEVAGPRSPSLRGQRPVRRAAVPSADPRSHPGTSGPSASARCSQPRSRCARPAAESAGRRRPAGRASAKAAIASSRRPAESSTRPAQAHEDRVEGAVARRGRHGGPTARSRSTEEGCAPSSDSSRSADEARSSARRPPNARASVTASSASPSADPRSPRASWTSIEGTSVHGSSRSLTELAVPVERLVEAISSASDRTGRAAGGVPEHALRGMEHGPLPEARPQVHGSARVSYASPRGPVNRLRLRQAVPGEASAPVAARSRRRGPSWKCGRRSNRPRPRPSSPP